MAKKLVEMISEEEYNEILKKLEEVSREETCDGVGRTLTYYCYIENKKNKKFNVSKVLFKTLRKIKETNVNYIGDLFNLESNELKLASSLRDVFNYLKKKRKEESCLDNLYHLIAYFMISENRGYYGLGKKLIEVIKKTTPKTLEEEIKKELSFLENDPGGI